VNRFVIITGLSGAGKTTAVQALEEFGFFTTDNLPPQLWRSTLDLCLAQGLTQVAVVTDARTRHFLNDVEIWLGSVAVKPVVVYLEADDEILIRRYGFTRRTHPLHESTLLGDLRAEREVLSKLREQADVVIDTSLLSAKALIAKLRGLFGEDHAFTLSLSSFGFKHGAPRDADLVLDVRGLPNPFYDLVLKHQSGLEPEVSQYVFSSDGTSFYELLRDFVSANAELARRSERSSYSVAIGCTGGFHRSVAVVEALARDLSQYASTITHRDLEKGEGGA
jgi:RNase adapter protein RapZ